jgi:glutathione S-transferase
MTTLYTATAAFGTRSASPFGTKAESLLRLARVPYHRVDVNPTTGPRQKIPYLDTAAGERITDSENIRQHLHRHHGLRLAPFALDHLVRRTVEESLYFAQMWARWTFHPTAVRDQLFADVPWPLRPAVFGFVARQVRTTLHGQGLGRRPEAEILGLVRDDLDALEAVLTGTTFGTDGLALADVVTHALLSQLLPTDFDDPLVEEVRGRPRLVALYEAVDHTLHARPALREVS